MTKKLLKKGGSNNMYYRSGNSNNMYNRPSGTNRTRSVGRSIYNFGSNNLNRIIVLIVIIGLAVGGYFLYKNIQKKQINLFKSVMLLDNLHDGSVNKIISNSKLPRATSSNEYNLSMWVYVNDYNYRLHEDKCILFKGILNGLLHGRQDQKINNSNPSVWLLANHNKLRIYTGLDTSYKNKKKDFIDIDYFPLQKWVHINLSLRNNILDVHINGKLHKSTILAGTPVINAGDLHLCCTGKDNLSGFNGYLSKVEYTNLALDSKKIYNTYTKGPNIKVKSNFFSNLFN